jgi:cytochrome P450
MIWREVAGHGTTLVGQPVPKGTRIIIVPWAINRDPAHWGPDANTFNPERWMGPGRANSGGAKSNYSFMTFLHGPRSCIGVNFARAEFAALLAVMIGRFEMELEDPEKELAPKGGLTSQPKNVMLRLRVVDGW